MDNLPESWQEALRAEAAAKKRRKRVSIEPVFSFWPWGVTAAMVPVAALYVSAALSKGFGLDYPGWAGGIAFYATLMFGNGLMISRAIAADQSHLRFACWSALGGIFSVLFFLVPTFAEIYFVFLAAFVTARLMGRIGFFALILLGIEVLVTIFLLPALVMFFKNSTESVLQIHSPSVLLGLAAAYPFAHSLSTGSMPVQATFFGRVDATFSGIASGALGLFVGIVVYRTAAFPVQFFPQLSVAPYVEPLTLGAAAIGLAVGNCASMGMLFRMAYMARAEWKEEPAAREREGDGDELAVVPLPEAPRKIAHAAPRAAALRIESDDDPAIHDAT